MFRLVEDLELIAKAGSYEEFYSQVQFLPLCRVTNRTGKLQWQPKTTQLGEQAIAIRLTDSNDDAFYFLPHP